MTGFEAFFNGAGPYLWLLTLIGLAVVGYFLWRANQRSEALAKTLDTFVNDKTSGGGIEELIMRLKRMEREAENLDTVRLALRELELRQNRSYQAVGLVRFNPFTDMGGDQSFALAILDANGDGFVMSSLHGRTATRVYSRTVIRGQANQTISNEEQAAIDQAMRNQQLANSIKFRDTEAAAKEF